MELLLIYVGLPVLVLMLWLFFSETAPPTSNEAPKEDPNIIAGGGVSSLAQMSSFLGM